MKPLVLVRKAPSPWSSRLYAEIALTPRTVIHVRRLKRKTVIAAYWHKARWFDYTDWRGNELIRHRIDGHRLLAMHGTSHSGYWESTIRHPRFDNGETFALISALVTALCHTLAHPPTSSEQLAYDEQERERRRQIRHAMQPTRVARHPNPRELFLPDPDRRRLTTS